MFCWFVLYLFHVDNDHYIAGMMFECDGMEPINYIVAGELIYEHPPEIRFC